MKKQLHDLPLKTVLIFVIILIVMNVAYYQNSKSILIRNQQEKMKLLVDDISLQIDQAAEGEKMLEDAIGQNLRTAAIAAQSMLPPHLDEVSNEELKRISGLVGVDDITLFKRTENDIVGLKSSDPKEIGVSSKGWGYYYTAFNQLLDDKEVTVDVGQKLPHYWSGPMDTSTTNPEQVDKWGYYHDGSTDYIIDPFVHDVNFRTYQSVTGVNHMIEKLLESNNNVALEMSVIYTDKLLKRLPLDPAHTENWFSERVVLFGQYNYRDSEENKYVDQAVQTNSTVFYLTTSGGKKVMKSFTPIHTKYLEYAAGQSPAVVEIASDYSEIERELHKQLGQTLWFMGIATSLAVAVMAFIVYISKRNKEKTLQYVQDAYVGNIDSLFQAIKEQRHDFSNHMTTIQALVTLKQYDELREYTNTLVGEISQINGMININHPPIIALLQAKIAHAQTKSVQFEHDFMNMGQLKLSTIKSTDVVKILSNLIDNAFDAALELEPEHRKVAVTGQLSQGRLEFKVSNTGSTIPQERFERLFESGYTTKANATNSGLGLHIVKQLVCGYHGAIDVTSEDGVTVFTVTIPLTEK